MTDTRTQAPVQSSGRRLAARERVDAVRAEPVVVGDCAGYFHGARGRIGVVLCGPWGYQDLCARTAWRMFAEQLAAAGFPSLRFDYPGAGNSLGDLDGRTLADWTAAAQGAAAQLRKLSGVEDIILAGLGHGAVVAVEACRAGLEAKGLVLFAPVASGRRFAREMSTWSAFADISRSERPADADATEVAGFTFPGAFMRAIRAFDLKAVERAPSPFALLALRDGTADVEAAHALEALGVHVECTAFDGYAEMMVSPTMSRPPEATIARMVEILRERFAAAPTPPAARVRHTGAAILTGPDFVEQAMRLGEDERLYGVLCRPGRPVGRTPIVLMLNAGRNSHTGWRRMNVEMARDLARNGVASLRFDLGSLGESAAASDQPEQILYSDWPVRDVVAAVDAMRSQGYGPIMLYGACSGAYLALRAAMLDDRIDGLLSANVYRLVWDPAETVEEALRYGNRRIGGAVTRMSRARIAAILTGAEDIRPKLRLAAKRLVRSAGVMTMGFAGRASPRHALYAQFRNLFDGLQGRGARVVLCYSPRDEGLNDYFDFFGRREGGLRRYPNVRRAMLPESDHNLTAPDASHRLVEELLRLASELTLDSGSASMSQTRIADGAEQRRA